MVLVVHVCTGGNGQRRGCFGQKKKVSDTEVDRKKKFQTLQSVLVRSNCEKVKVKNVK
jgi:hypothetical protein